MDILNRLSEFKEDQSHTIPKWQIEEVIHRIKSTKKEEYMSLDEVKKKLTYKRSLR